MTEYRYRISMTCIGRALTERHRKLGETTIHIDHGDDELLEDGAGFSEVGYRVMFSLLATAISRLCQHAVSQGYSEGALIRGVIHDLEGFLTDAHRTDIEVTVKK